MSNLYNFVIKDVCKVKGINNITEQKKKLFITAPVCSNDSACNEYQIDLKQYKNIIFGTPDSTNIIGYISISNPEIDREYIILTIVDFGIPYNNKNKVSDFVNRGGVIYFFHYSLKDKKYIFVKKKEYGI